MAFFGIYMRTILQESMIPEPYAPGNYIMLNQGIGIGLARIPTHYRMPVRTSSIIECLQVESHAPQWEQTGTFVPA
jgi:hypothetical protein